MGIKVLIVDDHDLVRTGIKLMLSDVTGIRVVGEASSGENAIDQSKLLQPDVVLMDVRMPGMGGLEATKKLLRVCPNIRILIVTVCDSDLFPTRLMGAGAYGYITKDASMDEMIKAIRTVYQRQRYISQDIANQLAIKALTDKGEPVFDMLSERELQVSFKIIAGNRVQEIADELCLSPKTVNSYRYRIFEKLDIKNDVELTHLAIKHGLIEKLSEANE
ncbi:UvrY/SirA/GacA family response regulator transcription factor [Gammaproteobacteria bacterium]|nr:UvrY/SirA/GacA family response regulator transcription factor [Gammaproteobacteria bacterium]